jgi:hypothetical protein
VRNLFQALQRHRKKNARPEVAAFELVEELQDPDTITGRAKRGEGAAAQSTRTAGSSP